MGWKGRLQFEQVTGDRELSVLRSEIADTQFGQHTPAGSGFDGEQCSRSSFGTTTVDDLARGRQFRPPRPSHPVVTLSPERVKRQSILGGLINEYVLAA